MNWIEMTEEQQRVCSALWMEADGRVDRFEASLGGLFEATVDPAACAREVGAELLVPWDSRFPAVVRDRLEIAGPWFLRGELPHGPRLAVVGSRATDHEGERVCKRIVSEVAAAGVVVVSGGAIGIDTVAHRAALAMGAPTVAILPSAFDRLTPARNKRLFAKIAQQGALVSEYPPGVTAHRFHFHRRNELIAAYADAVLVVRAKAVGGTMITARAATRLGTPLMVVPGSPEDETAAGCITLLREGAICVSSAEDVLEVLGVTGAAEPTQRSVPRRRLSASAMRVDAVLEHRPRTVDEIVAETALASHEVLVALTELELTGCVDVSSGRWRRRR